MSLPGKDILREIFEPVQAILHGWKNFDQCVTDNHTRRSIKGLYNVASGLVAAGTATAVSTRILENTETLQPYGNLAIMVGGLFSLPIIHDLAVLGRADIKQQQRLKTLSRNQSRRFE